MKKTTLKLILFFLTVLLSLSPVSVMASDFGLLLDQNVGLSGNGEEADIDYSASLVPRFSFLIGDTSEFFMSAGITADYANEEWNFTPELLRTDFTWRSGNAALRAGRMNYTDPLGFIASGLFDGARFSYDGGTGTFSAGAFYTGFLYKKTAYITITPEDQISFMEELDYDDFFDTYFASKRVVGALGWEHSALAGLLRARFALLGQADLNGEDSAFHSQYAVGKIGIPFGRFIFDLGGSFELAEIEDEIKFAYSGEAAISYLPPTLFTDRLSLAGRFTSGGTDGDLTAFSPITTETQGNILAAKISGLSLISLDYTARLHSTFSASLIASYFLRSDSATYQGYPVGEDDGSLLGAELFARLFWNPVSDIQLRAGGGAFLPSLGNASPDADPLWRVELSAVLALY